ncbi:MAG: hypothetical protein ABIW76_08630 [Fibrobacteria bacterium]
MTSREFHLNADFDASLRGAKSLLETSDPTYLHEMAWHFLFAAAETDSLIVHRPLPPDFLVYLAGRGLGLPRIVLHPEFTPGSRFCPFGWTPQTEALSLRYAQPDAHPDLRIVQVANSRAFNLEVERGWGEAWGEARGQSKGKRAEREPPGYLFGALADLENFLAARSEPLGWVIKGDHGHAGTGNRRVPSGALAEADRAPLAALFRDHGRVVAEPWHDRLLDMSVQFRVGKGGAISGFRGHVLLNSRDGAFLGVKILPGLRPPEPWDEVLEASAGELGRVLDDLGYFGPVSADAYVRNSPQGPRLRPVVDINARLSMALPAHGLADRLPGKSLLWMWSKPRKLNLPAPFTGYSDFEARLGAHAFDPDTRNGILAVSPLSIPGSGIRPKRVGFLFSADDEAGLARLQTAFAKALGRS